MADQNAIRQTYFQDPHSVGRPDVPGWGADLPREKRPGYPREANHENVLTQPGNTYDQVPRQVSSVEVLVSTEHKMCPPIFSTVCPPQGLSGIVRRRAFRYSEGKKAHWLLLMLADRIDVLESSVGEQLRGKLPRPIHDRGLGAEFKYHGLRSRWGHNRADMRRFRQQAVIVGTMIGGVAFVLFLTQKRTQALTLVKSSASLPESA